MQEPIPEMNEVDEAKGISPDAVDALAYRFWSIHPKELDELRVSMPEGYRGGVRAWFFACEMRRLLAASSERAETLERERDDADRRAGAAERLRSYAEESRQLRQSWLSDRKRELGYEDGVSFDRVWADTLAKARSVPELELRIAALKTVLEWFLENDDTNEGDVPMPEHGGRTWNELNAFWIDGLVRAREAIAALDPNSKLEPTTLEAAANIIERMSPPNAKFIASRLREEAIEIRANSTIQENDHVGRQGD